MSPLDLPVLSESQVAELADTLTRWARAHPNRDRPVVAFAGGRALAPSQIAAEVRERTPDGIAFVRMIRCGMEVASFEDILKSFTDTFEYRNAKWLR